MGSTLCSARFKIVNYVCVSSQEFARESTGYGTDLILSVGAQGRLIPATFLYRVADHVVIARHSRGSLWQPRAVLRNPYGVEIGFLSGFWVSLGLSLQC